MSGVRLLVALALAAACMPRVSAGDGSQSPAPHVISVRPETVAVERGGAPSLTITGRGFVGSGNTVYVGPVRLNAVPASNDGRTIRMTVPDAVPSNGGAPPADWLPGRYAVVVSNANGQSDTAWITIVPKAVIR